MNYILIAFFIFIILGALSSGLAGVFGGLVLFIGVVLLATGIDALRGERL